MKFNWKDEVMLITGASAGLGRALAIKAGELGATVVLIARDKERTASAAKEIDAHGGRALDYSFDLQHVDRIPDLYKRIVQDTNATPTILINNVGYQVAGFIQNTPVEVYEKNYRINTLAPVALIQCVLPDMLKQEKGVIANVMSSIMYHAFPGVSSYCASKKALGAIHESLKAELVKSPIKTLYIRPGSFKSNYWMNTDIGERIKDFIYPSGEGLRDPSYVAAKICKTIERGKEDINLSSLKDKIGHHLNYWGPRTLDRVIAYKNKKLLAKRPGI